MKNILRENMRRFGTKNLLTEDTQVGELIIDRDPAGNTLTFTQDDVTKSHQAVKAYLDEVGQLGFAKYKVQITLSDGRQYVPGSLEILEFTEENNYGKFDFINTAQNPKLQNAEELNLDAAYRIKLASESLEDKLKAQS